MRIPGFLFSGLIWFAVVLVVAIPQGQRVAFAQVPDAPGFIIDQWQAEEGLTHSAVTSVLQGQDGYIWLGTGAGLVRFDGIRFVNVFEQNVLEGQQPLLADSYVWSIAEGAEGVLWVGTSNGLIKYKNHRVQPFTTADGLPNNFVRSVTQAQASKLWVGTYGGGVCLFDVIAETCEHLGRHPAAVGLQPRRAEGRGLPARTPGDEGRDRGLPRTLAGDDRVSPTPASGRGGRD